jgi:hypothetical protein
MDDEFGMIAPKHAASSRSPWPQQRAAVATPEEIRYAQQLWLQIRESYLSRRDPPPSLDDRRGLTGNQQADVQSSIALGAPYPA